MSRLVFVTPAHARPGLTALCLEQRRRVIDTLAADGIEADCVVVGDDENLRVADDLGFHTIRQANRPMGRKWNTGIRHACTVMAADYVVPIGTDDWVTPAYLRALPDPEHVKASDTLALVDPDGGELVVLDLPKHARGRVGYIPWIIPAGLLAASGYRPAHDGLNTGFDASVANEIHGRATEWTRFELTLTGPVQIVDFKSPTTQITPYQLTRAVNPFRQRTDRPFELLAEHYPPDLVDRMQALYHGSP